MARDQAGERTAVIELKDGRAIERMRRAGAVVAETLALLRERAAPGVTTRELDDLARELIVSRGGIPTFLGVEGPIPFPGAICASINEEVVHGIPGARALRNGDLLKIDVGVTLDGWSADSATTIPVGAVSAAALALIRDSEAALAAGIAAARAGNRLADISLAIQRVARRAGYGIVREYTGHGIGRSLWEEPPVPNYHEPEMGSGPILRAGMTLAIEPIFAIGSPETVTLPDGWTVITADRALAAHVEHTIAIPARGPALILTK